MLSEGYSSCYVCVSVCLSVKQPLTSGASIHPESTVTYSMGNVDRNISGVFSETALFQSYCTSCIVILSLQNTRVALLKCHIDCGVVLLAYMVC